MALTRRHPHDVFVYLIVNKSFINVFFTLYLYLCWVFPLIIVPGHICLFIHFHLLFPSRHYERTKAKWSAKKSVLIGKYAIHLLIIHIYWTLWHNKRDSSYAACIPYTYGWLMLLLLLWLWLWLQMLCWFGWLRLNSLSVFGLSDSLSWNVLLAVWLLLFAAEEELTPTTNHFQLRRINS